MLTKLPAKRETPLQRFDLPGRGFSQEHLVLRPDVVLGRRVPGRVHPLGEPWLRHEVRADDGVLEKFVDPLPHLADDGIRRELLVEDGRDVVQDGGMVSRPADGRGGADADESVTCLEPSPQPPDETGEIRPLRAIESVELVHYEITQEAAFVVSPEREVDGTCQQEVEHLVVREQDVRRALAQHVAVLDQVTRGQVRPGRGTGLSHVQSRGHLSPERLRAVDDPGNPSRLIRSERVHGIDEDGLDAGGPGPLAAVIEHRIEEALRLAGARSRRDDGGLASRQPIEGGALVPVRGEAERRLGERLPAFRGPLKRQLDREIRTLEQVVGVGEEVVDHGGQRSIRRPESGSEKVLQSAANLGGERGGNHDPQNHAANANVRARRATLRAVAGNHASSRPAPSGERADRARIPRRFSSLALAPMGWQRACVTGAPSGSRG